MGEINNTKNKKNEKKWVVWGLLTRLRLDMHDHPDIFLKISQQII